MFIQSRGKRGGGQIEFIEAAMKNLQSYGVQKELDVYKALLKVFPEGDLLPQNPIQVKIKIFDF
jgi:evolutionarily conserved signaling intermediate in Toll pathway